jgi:[acyl-carrier-protein] S-malonyltransferase
MTFAFVFPGQGSQSVGMMAGYGDAAVVRATFEEASDVLGQDFWQLATAGPEDLLARTVITQPLMLTAGVAVWRLWCERSTARPTVVAGHSLGEYSALVAAGALEFGDALQLTRCRAEAMQTAVPEGAGGMAAILGLDDAAVEAACAEAAHGEVLEAANFNSPGQVVIAGSRAAVERGMAVAKARGAKRAVLLPMSVPSHCSLMRGAAEQLGVLLATTAFRVPTIPVIHNCDMTTHTLADGIRSALTQQLYRPVRWVGTLQVVAAAGMRWVAECGPGKVLTPLVRRGDDRLQGVALNDAAGIDAFARTLMGAEP